MAPRVDTEKLITAVETHPPLWDTRVDGYHDRLTVDRHWNQVAEEVYPNNAWSRCSPAKRAKYVDLVKRRWRSARDQYRREYNPIPSSSSQGRKRRYVYYEQISFLAPILEVTQTEDNLDESDDEPTAGPSATATSASEQEPAREDIEIPETQQDAANDSHEGGTESAQTNTQGSSTQQTTTPATQSTQTNVLPRFAPQPLRARRIRRPEEMRSLPEIIDTRIIHIMNTLIPETDAERFCRSLSTSLTKIPSDRQERVRAAMLTLLSASQAEQEPVRVYEAIENWRTIMQQHTVPNTTDNQNTISTQTTMATVIVNNPLLQQSGQPSIASSTLFPTPIRQGYVATNTGALSTVQSATSQQPMNYMNLQPTQTTSYFTQPTNIGGLPNLFPGSTYPQSFMMPHYPISTMLPTPHLQTSVNYPQGQQHTHTQYPITHVDPQARESTWQTQLKKVFDTEGEVDNSVDSRNHRELCNQVKSLFNRRMRLWWNKAFMQRYVDRGLIPRGLRVQVFPSFSVTDETFKRDWEEAASPCSRSFMGLLINNNEASLRAIDEEISVLQDRTTKELTPAELSNFHETLNKEFVKWEKELVSTKTKKYQRDVTDYKNQQVYRWKGTTRRRRHFVGLPNSVSASSISSMEDESSTSQASSRPVTRGFSGKNRPDKTPPAPGKSTLGAIPKKGNSNQLEVINLSQVQLSDDQIEVLKLGLTFVPDCSFDLFTVAKDLNLFLRKVVLHKIHARGSSLNPCTMEREEEAVRILEELEGQASVVYVCALGAIFLCVTNLVVCLHWRMSWEGIQYILIVYMRLFTGLRLTV
ncbi:uncharacterized protein LOC142279344 [Anomaloglossus baeobatrachus]|uniref:uncharacterized protein LOC142279344 n=1 Tax=Anomaloglossus baeobatrachus TaxID=238106 RepID=UPI003F508FE6